MKIKTLAMLLVFGFLFPYCPHRPGEGWASIDGDGSTTEVNCGDNDAFTPTAFTITAWVKRASTGVQDTIFSKDGSAPDYEYAFGFFTDNLMYGVVWDASSGNYIGRTGPQVAANVWRHIAMTWNGGTTEAGIDLYTDGTATDSGSFSAGVFGGIDNGISPLLIAGTSATLGLPTGGQVDDVRFYNRALSAAEIQSLALSRSRLLITDGLIGWWKLDEGNDGITASGSNSVLDSSGNGRHCTPNNSPTWFASEWINFP